MKRLLDVLIVCALLVLGFPLIAVVALAIKIESGGPVCVRERCVGRRGRQFKMLQFRTTMKVPDGPGPRWDAGRLTRVGAFLRYTRIESLPQLFNVLRGDMRSMRRGARRPFLSE